MKIFGTLDTAALENLSADPATSLFAGRLYFNTSTKAVRLYNGSSWQDALGGSGGTGEKNYVSNPSAAIDTAGWTASGTISISRDTSTSLPRKSTTGTGFKLVSSSDEAYAYTPFTLDTADLSRKLGVILAQATSTANWRVEVWQNSASDYTGTYTELTLSTDSSGDSYLPALTGTYETTFDGNGTAYLELRLVHNGTSSDTLYVSDIVVGPGTVVQGAGGVGWQAFTPTGTWTSNTTYTGKWRRVGTQMEIQIKVALSGAPNSTALTVDMVPGYTIDPDDLVHTTGNDTVFEVGRASTKCAAYSAAGVIGNVVYRTTGTFLPRWYAASGTGNKVQGANFDQSNPGTYASGDYIEMSISVPIAEWAGSGMANLGQNDVEWASNSGTWDATDTTSFVNGPSGSTISGDLSSARRKRIRFQSPIQTNDALVLEILHPDTNTWIPMVGATRTSSTADRPIQALARVNSVLYGVGFYLSTGYASTDVDIYFGQYINQNYSTLGGAGDGWSVFTNAKWRVRKFSGGQAVGFAAATTTSSGLLQPVSSMSNSLATMLGRKVYSHGGSYNGGLAPTVTLSSGGGTLSSVGIGDFIPYQMQDGTWRMKFNIAVAVSSTTRTAATLAIAGVTFYSTTGDNGQAISGTTTTAGLDTGYVLASSGAGTVTITHGSGTTLEYQFSGDVRLNSKPTWAY